jgi:hypothetical protein
MKNGENSSEFNLWIDSIKRNYDNVIEIACVELEREVNLKNHSKIKAS